MELEERISEDTCPECGKKLMKLIIDKEYNEISDMEADFDREEVREFDRLLACPDCSYARRVKVKEEDDQTHSD